MSDRLLAAYVSSDDGWSAVVPRKKTDRERRKRMEDARRLAQLIIAGDIEHATRLVEASPANIVGLPTQFGARYLTALEVCTYVGDVDALRWLLALHPWGVYVHCDLLCVAAEVPDVAQDRTASGTPRRQASAAEVTRFLLHTLAPEDLQTAQTITHRHPLHEAVQLNQVQVVIELVRNGWPLDVKDHNGDSLLERALHKHDDWSTAPVDPSVWPDYYSG